MNRFLFEKFPLSYSRIYKAIIQNEGKKIIPESIKNAGEGKNLDDLLDSKEGEMLSYDVYTAIKDIRYIAKCGYLQILNIIPKKIYGINLTPTVEAIVLQISESQRWKRRFGVEENQIDLILAIPLWSRVVSLSTSDIHPKALLKGINQFDVLNLDNYHFYEIFNKLHGVSGRNVSIVPRSDTEKAHNVNNLNFILRTVEDVKLLSSCMNLRLFTIVSDINGIPRVGFYFSLVCSVGSVKQALKPDGIGLDPYSFELTVVDESGRLNIRLNSSNFVRSIRKLYLAHEINHLFGSKKDAQEKFEDPSALSDYSGHFLLIGNWFLGDDLPNITYMVPLNSDINCTKYQLVGFMNTRKKYPLARTKPHWKNNFHAAEMSKNLKMDSTKTWVLYKEYFWDEAVFKMMIEKKFEKPQFHEQLKFGISSSKFLDWQNSTGTYLRINEFIKNLYISNVPEDEFSNAYPQFSASESDVEHFQSKTIKQIPDLIPVHSWSTIKKYVPKLIEESFSIDEVFDWRNGGKKLQSRALIYYSRSEQQTSLQQVIWYIHLARGCVMLPKKIVDEKPPD